MNTAYLVFLGLYLGSLIIRTSYELLKRADKVNPKSTIVFAVVFADEAMGPDLGNYKI